MELSEEQRAVVEAVCSGDNVAVEAVAGCGKTTTIMHICAQTRARTLILTYNARLKDETKRKVRPYTHVDAHNYHSAACKYFRPNTFTEAHMDELLTADLPPIRPIAFDIVIIDEAQDMTGLYFRFVSKIVRENGRPVQFVLLGDAKQRIYECFGADERYLTLAERVFGGMAKPAAWRTCTLSTSFRITAPIASLVNSLIRPGFIRAAKPGPNVQYFATNLFDETNVYNIIRQHLKTCKPGEIFVLANSVKNPGFATPMMRLENRLVRDGFPCFYPSSDDEELDDGIAKGKIVFSSFHQVKGLERRVVIVFGFDTSYLKTIRDEGATECPNPIYVAVTRALERLVLIHDHRFDYFPFFNQGSVEGLDLDVCTTKPSPPTSPPTARPIAVTSLVAGLSYENEKLVAARIERRQLRPPETQVRLPTSVKYGWRVERTAAIHGVALPALVCRANSGRFHLLDVVRADRLCFPASHRARIDQIDAGTEVMADILYVANLYLHRGASYRSSLEQMEHYNWLEKTPEDVIDRARATIGPIRDYEREVQTDRLRGVIDFQSTDGCIWEVKCTACLTEEHVRQLAMYAAILGNAHTYKLFNLLTGEIVEVVFTDELPDLPDFILDLKSRAGRERACDEAFVSG